MLVVRHRDRPGVLAHVFDQLRGGDINVQETENIIFEGAEAAVARINVDGRRPKRARISLRRRIAAGKLDNSGPARRAIRLVERLTQILS